MSTDRERLKELLTSFGLGFTDESYSSYSVVLEAKKGNVQGYAGFVADFEFNEDGSFERLSIWE